MNDSRTPAARLQAAATHLHKAAAAADAEIQHAYFSDYPRVARAQLAAPLGEYAALMHPGVGSKLAALLVSAAYDARMVGADPAAVALADAILAGGGQ
ncbi:hypothetical protein V2S66_03160 [Streptomyces sp. V4-01]|uniref:Uncharacterized protein n=1 Tax=Actinacidiphila polyblastidii TaxID=3110430 RepID=A0ABU7P581_9ACTN|nr:hypothetical protein [Streptomyces sp. V4-01]